MFGRLGLFGHSKINCSAMFCFSCNTANACVFRTLNRISFPWRTWDQHEEIRKIRTNVYGILSHNNQSWRAIFRVGFRLTTLRQIRPLQTKKKNWQRKQNKETTTMYKFYQAYRQRTCCDLCCSVYCRLFAVLYPCLICATLFLYKYLYNSTNTFLLSGRSHRDQEWTGPFDTFHLVWP